MPGHSILCSIGGKGGGGEEGRGRREGKRLPVAACHSEGVLWGNKGTRVPCHGMRCG